jgi:hypothetical protein
MRLMEANRGRKITITSPVLPFITYSLMDACRIIVVHEQNHFVQATRDEVTRLSWVTGYTTTATLLRRRCGHPARGGPSPPRHCRPLLRLKGSSGTLDLVAGGSVGGDTPIRRVSIQTASVRPSNVESGTHRG